MRIQSFAGFVFVLTLTFMVGSQPAGAQMEVIPPIITLLPSDPFQKSIGELSKIKYTIVHYTSTDGSCDHCLNNNPKFEDAHLAMGDVVTFAQVSFNPWRSYLEKHKWLPGLPTTMIYSDGVPIFTTVGYRENLLTDLDDGWERQTKKLYRFYYPPHHSEIASAELENYIATNEETYIFVHVTTRDKRCPFCHKDNQFFRHAAVTHHDDYGFAEITYERLRDAGKDDALSALLGNPARKATGLPVTLTYKAKKLVDIRKGIWPEMTEDLTKFSR